MATTRKRTAKTAAPSAAQVMGEHAVRDLVKQELRKAFGDHARELEQIFSDINTRLEKLEK